MIKNKGPFWWIKYAIGIVVIGGIIFSILSGGTIDLR